ncbi:helix-turn-helix domain-containing protein [Vibrio cholerae]|nr:helix-turn-helix domain-containing protein [Vibrio cholerae]
MDRTGVQGLAARLGYSSRHLNRILRDELGAGALALARAHRAQTARTLLSGSTLRFADVAFAAGFGSIRQFNDTVRQVFDLTPQQVRDAAQQKHGAAGGSGSGDGPVRIPLSLPVRLPYDNGIFRFLEARAVAGVERGTASTYERLVRLPLGPACFTASAVLPRGDGQGALPVTVSVSKLADLPALLGRIRRLFDLDADPIAIDAGLARAPSFARLVAATPGMRLPGSLDPHETVVRAIVGQQVSVTSATAALGLLAAGGAPVRMPGTELTRDFPSAADLAGADEPLIRGPRRRSSALRSAAQRLASGELEVDIGADPGALRAALLQLDGVGPWTADYVLMRVLGHPDIHLPTDAAVRSGWARLDDRSRPRPGHRTPDTSASLEDAMAAVRPWRSYATLHLWGRAAAPAPPTGDDPPSGVVA